MNNTQPIQRGMTFGYYARNGYYSTKDARKEVDHMCELNIDSVCVVATVLQETFASVRQFRDFYQTPADDELREIIDYIHGKGLKVQLRPMLECWDGAQRLQIRFPGDAEIIPGKRMTYYTQWFDSMVKRTLHYASLAQRAGCEIYCLDSELDYTVGQQTHWRTVVQAARSVFGGHITTGHTRCVNFVDEFKEHPDHWFYELDSLGCSFYCPVASNPETTIEQMSEFLRPELEYFKEVAYLYKKPFYFAECGCCSTAGATIKPYGWDNPGGYDGAEQANYLEAVLSTFWNEPWWSGLYWWKWEEQNNRPWLKDDPRGDKGFPVWEKPAAKVMQRWYGRTDRR